MNRRTLKYLMLPGIFLLAAFALPDHFIQERWLAPSSADTLKNPYQSKWGERAVPREALADGQQLYQSYCVTCHGKSGDGSGAPGMTFTVKPANFHDTLIKRQTDGALFWKLSEGRGMMPSYKSSLSADQRWRLIAYIREIQNNPGLTRADPNRMSPAGYKLAGKANGSYFPTPAKISNAYKSLKQTYAVDTLISTLDRPWSMLFLPDNRLLIAERNGGIRVMSKGKFESRPIQGDIPAEMRDMKLHPGFSENRLIYFSHYKNPVGKEGGYTILSRAKLMGNQITGVEEIYRAGPFRQGAFWYGSKIAFDEKGYLYFTVGISGARKNAQDLAQPSGKTMRLKDDGSVPDDNPFVNKEGALPEIFTYGHRMHEGLAFDPRSRQLFSLEFGELGGDELNILKAGANYGWPEVTFSLEYSGKPITTDSLRADVEAPAGHWKMAPSDLDFNYGDQYPAWKGDIFAGAIFDKYVARITLRDNKVISTEKLLNNIGRVRDVKVGPDGYIYAVTEDSGLLVRILPLSR